jgi:hypothetical protein
MGASVAKLPVWYRVLALVVGLITIALAFIVLVDPALGLLALVFLLAFALLVMGFDRLIAGITGHPFGWMMATAMRPPSEVPPTPPGTPPSPPRP